MEQLPGGYTLNLPDSVFPLSTDSMVLSHFVSLPANARVLDLGSGGGTLGLLLCAGNSTCHVTGIEIDADAHSAAEDNILRNRLSHRMVSICTDLRQIASLIPPGSIHCCVSNPPYYSGGPASRNNVAARRDDFCSVRELCAAASRALQYGGDFYLVHKPEKLGEILGQGAAFGLEGKELCLLRHREDGPISLILLKLRKGAKPGLRWQEAALHHADGTPTELYREIYHI